MHREKPDANWWSFSIAEAERGEKIRDDASAGTIEVNPAADGLRLLSYHKYLGLGQLLSCQVPSSRAPEERIFVITHQLFELVFKQMIFDLKVIAETFCTLLAAKDADFSALLALQYKGKQDTTVEGFWRPARTAAARVKHSAANVLPRLLGYLADDETFNNVEFAQKFRDNLSPASGFQSAQFRLIQRALGKSPLLEIRLFPADTYLRAYAGKSDAEIRQIILASGNAGLVSVVDRLILQEDTAVATPPADSPLAAVAALDDLAHQVLTRVATMDGAAGKAGQKKALSLLSPVDEKGLAMEHKFQERLREVVEKRKKEDHQPLALTAEEQEMIEKRGAVFGKDWAKALDRENRRRAQYKTAWQGATLLLQEQPAGPLASLLTLLTEADSDLYGKFLFFHRNVITRRIGEVPGTAGGGVPYLDFSRALLSHFPALALFQGMPQMAR